MSAEEWEKLTPEERKERFRSELKEGLQKSVDGRNSAAVYDVCRRWNRNIPPEYDGSRDRTYGYHALETILKTLGEEGLAQVVKIWLPFDEVRTACLNVLGHAVPCDLIPGRATGRLEFELAADGLEKAFLRLQSLDYTQPPGDIGRLIRETVNLSQKTVLALRGYAATGEYVDGPKEATPC